MSLNNLYIITISLCLIIITSHSQPQPPSSTCNAIFLSYTHTNGYQIPPTNLTNQAYRFESAITILNNGLNELKSWKVFVGFQHTEFLVSATNAVLADGSSLPAFVGDGTIFAGFPETDLKSAVETAGDVTKMEVQIRLVGTQFGVGAPNVPMPANLSLANDGYICPPPTTQGNNEMNLCCTKDANFKSNLTVEEDKFLARQDGDLIIMYDVIRSYESNYWAQVSVSNHNALGRLDNWKLSWDWMRQEFIYTMRGAYPILVDTSQCIFGSQGQFYKDMDFSSALNCERRPTIFDLPPTKADDTLLGKLPFCCRNGTILPPIMDSTKSTSLFQMQVYKMPPDTNRTDLIPPQNWKINGTSSPEYQCGSPVRVSPSTFPSSNGLSSESTAVASWQVVCNITVSKEKAPTCCVSFSAFYNDSAIPCNTCACGCNNNNPSQTCSTTDQALLLPPEVLLIPFENRTLETLEWAKINRQSVPNPLPCGDNCGVSINWHLLEDFKDGWTARITLFNWGETNFADWFAAVQLDKAGPGFEAVYSFNGTAMPGGNTIFFQGLPGLNYLTSEQDSSNPRKHPRIPGKQQSVISFTTKTIPNIDVAKGDGFPTKVIFNGQECSLPTMLPTGSGHKMGAVTSLYGFLTLLALLLIQ